MRNLAVFAHFDAFWVDEDELKVFWAVPHNEGHDKTMDEDGFTRTGRTGYKHMREVAHIGGDDLALD